MDGAELLDTVPQQRRFEDVENSRRAKDHIVKGDSGNGESSCCLPPSSLTMAQGAAARRASKAKPPLVRQQGLAGEWRRGAIWVGIFQVSRQPPARIEYPAHGIGNDYESRFLAIAAVTRLFANRILKCDAFRVVLGKPVFAASSLAKTIEMIDGADLLPVSTQIRRSYATGRFLPRWGGVDRNTVEFVTFSVGDAYCVSTRAQLGTNDAKFAREAFSLFDRNFGVFKDHSALAFEIIADDEIEIKVWHWTPCQSYQLFGYLNRVPPVPQLKIRSSPLIAVAYCGLFSAVSISVAGLLSNRVIVAIRLSRRALRSCATVE